MALTELSKAHKALAQVNSLQDALDLRSVAVAAEAYASARGADEAVQLAIEVKLRAERKAGQFLQEMKEYGIVGRGIKSDTLSDFNIEHHESKRWQRIASIPTFLFEEYINDAKTLSQSALLREAARILGKPHVSRATGEDEWYTPKNIIEAARKLMGTIDVDPASSDVANQIIQATTYYTAKDNGLIREWGGNVWMNPPYSQPLVTQFCNLLVKKYVSGEIDQACVLVNNATETQFYQNMMYHARAICFIKGRVKFVDKNGELKGAPLQGQTVLYFGDNMEDFGIIFSKFGVVLYAH